MQRVVDGCRKQSRERYAIILVFKIFLFSVCVVGRNADIWAYTHINILIVWWRVPIIPCSFEWEKGSECTCLAFCCSWFPGVVLFSVTSLQSERILNSSRRVSLSYRWLPLRVDFALALNLWFQCLLCTVFINTSVYSLYVAWGTNILTVVEARHHFNYNTTVTRISYNFH